MLCAVLAIALFYFVLLCVQFVAIVYHCDCEQLSNVYVVGIGSVTDIKEYKKKVDRGRTHVI